MTKQDLLARIDAHETEGAAIETAMTELGVTAKDMKALRKAQASAKAAKEALDKLMGIGAVEACADVADETAPVADEAITPDPNAEPITGATEDAPKKKGA